MVLLPGSGGSLKRRLLGLLVLVVFGLVLGVVDYILKVVIYRYLAPNTFFLPISSFKIFKLI